VRIKLFGGPFDGGVRDLPDDFFDDQRIVIKLPQTPEVEWSNDPETALQPIRVDRYRLRRAKLRDVMLFPELLPAGIYPGDWYGVYDGN
jgi:hypothetical protein